MNALLRLRFAVLVCVTTLSAWLAVASISALIEGGTR